MNADDFGRFYIGAIHEGRTLFYSWDGMGWRFAPIDQEEGMYTIFTRMNVKVAKESMAEVRETYPGLQMFLVPREDAKMWGIQEVEQ